LSWLPFVLVIGVLVMGAFGLAYSLYPYVVMNQMTLWQAASAHESLVVILFGCAFAVPAILGYTVFAYRVFSGKASELDYG
jgi:cytochrome bd ubiquinol oxidase subunit II